MHKRRAGFTLIEVLIVVAIVAILASLAFASYRNSIEKTKRADAKDALTKAAALQEKHYLQANQYTDNMADIGGDTSTDDNYTLSAAFSITEGACGSGDTNEFQCFTLTATARNSQLSDTTCRTFTVDNLGRKSAQDSTANDTSDECW